MWMSKYDQILALPFFAWQSLFDRNQKRVAAVWVGGAASGLVLEGGGEEAAQGRRVSVLLALNN